MKENIFPAVFEIIDQARTMSAALTRMENEERQIAADYCNLYEQEMKNNTIKQNIETIRAARIAKENKLKQNETTKTQIKILLPILHDNAQAKAAETMKHYIAGILHKWEGKKPGPKTADKINDSFNAATGCRLYFHNIGTRSYISVYPDNYYFNTSDFEFTANGGITDNDNKIIAHTADELKLTNSPTYINDPAQRVDEIIEAYKEMKAAEEEMQRKIAKFNEILPAKIDSIHVMTSRNYIVI